MYECNKNYIGSMKKNIKKYGIFRSNILNRLYSKLI